MSFEFDKEFFNSHSMFNHLKDGELKELKNSWFEKSKAISNNNKKVYNGK